MIRVHPVIELLGACVSELFLILLSIILNYGVPCFCIGCGQGLHGVLLLLDKGCLELFFINETCNNAFKGVMTHELVYLNALFLIFFQTKPQKLIDYTALKVRGLYLTQAVVEGQRFFPGALF